MKHYFFIILATGTLLASSCTTIKKTATSVNVQTGIYQYPTVAELDVKEKVEVSTSWNFRPFHIGEPKVSIEKGNLIAETLKANNADILLEPQMIFRRTSFGERRLTITGYPASFKNFRKATKEDIEALKINREENERTVYNKDGNIFTKILGK